MQNFRTLFSVAFGVALTALIVSFLIGLQQSAEPTNYLWYDTLQQLNELGRAKYRQSRRYGEYALCAEREHRPELATLFRALAYADNVQCNNCRRAIESLGGIFHTPILLPTEQQESTSHLHDALNHKYSLHEGLTMHCLHRVTEEGNRYIARLITWCDVSDIKQILLLERHLTPHTLDTLRHQLRVCPNCSAIEEQRLHSSYCPHCMTESTKFVLFK